MKCKIYNFVVKNKKLLSAIGSIFLIIILLLIGYKVGGGFKSSKTKVYSKLENAINSNDVKELSNIVRVDGKQVSEEELQPFFQYYKEKDKINFLISELNKNQNSGKNYIDIKSRSLDIQTNFKNTKIMLQDKVLGETSEDNSSVTIKNVIPGIYKVRLTNDSYFGILSEEKEVVIEDGDVTENIPLKGVKVSINHPIKDGKVLVNGKSTEYDVKDFKDIGPIPNDGSIKISILNSLPWGEIESEAIQVNDIPVINIPLKFDNDKLVNIVQDTSKEFYDSLFKALNSGDKTIVKNSSKEATDKIFGIVEKKYKYFKNNYTVDNLEFTMESSEFKYDGTFKANIIVSLNYSISKNVLGIKFSETKESKKIMTKLAYINNQWIIEEVENFNV